MDYDRFDDLIQAGRGRAAIAVGDWHDLHRPRDPFRPLRGGTTRMRMQAFFTPSEARGLGYGHPLYEGVLDASYTQPGDYLVGPLYTWFVASQQQFLPVLCVKATRTVTVQRMQPRPPAGLGAYGGLQRDAAVPVLTAWPASMVSHGFGMDRVNLPGDAQLGGWSVLLPPLPGIMLRTGDLLTDDLGRAGVVSWAELSDLGWRLFVRQAAS
jgi:hypothetical protein